MESTRPLNQSSHFTQLYSEHHTWLYHWLTKRLGNQHDAADLAQETFIRLLQKQEQYQNYNPRPLLTTIAKNLSNSWWQRKQIEQAYYEALQQHETHYAPSPEEETIAIETLMILHHVLNSLKNREKQVFILSQIEGLNYIQIAEKLEISIITVKRDIKHAMLKCLLTMQFD